ncbi:MAG: alkaline phosphatase D family protein [Thermomicrobiales bacterium]
MINRRTFILTAAAGLALPRRAVLSYQGPSFSANPFTLGIASGEPASDGFVIWTRLAPEPLVVGGGLPAEPIAVYWQVATDEGMSQVVKEGTAAADPAWAHALHVEVSGLEPDRWYWYQFKSGSEISPVGRTRTTAAAGAPIDQFRFAFASCQDWSDGFYVAYQDVVAQDLDAVVFLGDYIYEKGLSDFGGVRRTTVPREVRSQPRALDQYRLRYSLYKTDPDLQAAHAQFPWIVTWDDHEVENDYAGDTPNPIYPKEEFLRRRAAAYQAFYEHMPLRQSAQPRGPALPLYRRLAFGELIALNLLDTRQYRSHQHLSCSAEEHLANGGYCAPSLDPSRTMLGEEQKAWLLDGLSTSSSHWNVLAQQVPMAQNDTQAGAGVTFGGDIGDKWDGYAYERDDLLATMAEISRQRPLNPVVITGDVHDNRVHQLKTDWNSFDDASAIAVEFVGTSITSEGDDPLMKDGGFTTRCGTMPDNPHQSFFDNHRGYVLCTVTPDRWQTDFRVVPTVEEAVAPASTLATFVVEHGRPLAEQSTSCPAQGTPVAER